MSFGTTSNLPNLHSYYLDDEDADVFFDCGNDEVGRETITAHKIILGAGSDYFHCMFRGSLPETQNPIRFPDTSPNGLRTVLRYFYFNKFDDYMLNMDVIDEAIYLAKKFLIGGYLRACCQFLEQQASVEGILTAFELSITHELLEVKRCMSFKIFACSDIIFASEYFFNISVEMLENIVKSEYAFVSKHVITGTLKWAEEACKKTNTAPTMQNCRHLMGNVMNNFEFGMMARDELLECVEKFTELFTKQEIQEIIVITAARWPSCPLFPMVINSSNFRLTDLKKLTKGTTQDLLFIAQTRVLLTEIHISNLFVEDTNKTKSVFLKIKLVKVRNKNEVTPKEVVLSAQFLKYGNTIAKSEWQMTGSTIRMRCLEGNILEPGSVYAIRTIPYDDCWYFGRQLPPNEESCINVCHDKSSSDLIHSLRIHELNLNLFT